MNAEIEPHILKMFEIKKRIGKGAYGIVWKALNKKTKEIIALKKIFDAFRNQTDAQRTFREIAFLQNFGNHPNIVRLYNVIRASSDKDIYLVFEFMETDLHNVIKKGNILNDVHKQYIMYQLLKATAYLHSGEVIHRDQKPSNVLLDSDCLVKLCDFGLARSLKGRNMKYDNGNGKINCKTLLPALTEYVATRWYRAPEILLACHDYTKGVDIWSLGCILGEMLIGTPLFPGTSTLDQIGRIMAGLPKLSREDMESIRSPYSISILEKTHIKRRPLDQILKNANKTVMDLLNQMINFNPHKRIDALTALKHPYVRKFFNPEEIMSKTHNVVPPLDDNIQLTVTEYRNRLYQIINSKKLRRHNRTKAMDQLQNAIPNTTQTEKSDCELTVRNEIAVNKITCSELRNNHLEGGKQLEPNQTPSTMNVNHKSFIQPVNRTTPDQECHKNSHLNVWNPENMRPISDLATYTVKSSSSLSVVRPCSHTESMTNVNNEELSCVGGQNYNDSSCEHENINSTHTVMVKPSDMAKSSFDQKSSSNHLNTSILNKESRICISTSDCYHVNEADNKTFSHSNGNIYERCNTPSNLRSKQKLNGSIQNNLNSGINQPYNDQLDPQTMNNDTNSINGTHDTCKLNGSSSISRINNNNSFRKSFSSFNLPSSSSSSPLSTSIIKNKFDQLNTNLIQPNESLNHSYGSYQYQQQSVSNSTLNCNSNEQLNINCTMNNSLVEMKKPESLLDKSDQEFENPFGKTLISINNRLNHLLKTNYPSSSTVITSSSSSSDWLKCQSPTPIKSKSSSSSSSSSTTTTTTMSSSHKWLNANDNIEQNKSKFVTMNKSHKYNFSKSTNNLLNHSNILNNSSSLSSGQLTPCQIQTTTNLNEERNYKSISENKINELDIQNRRFASAPLLPAPLLTGNIIRNRPVINITSTTTTTTTTKSTGDIFNSTKLNSKSYLISSNTGSSSVIRLHSSSELNNLFQDYRLRRTSKSTSIDESISPGCVSSNDIHTNNQRHTNINNHHTTNLAQFYHPSHLRNDSMQPNLNGIHGQHSDLGKSSVKYMSTASNILDIATEASKNPKIQLSTSDSQVNHVIRTKFLSNGISNNTSSHQKSYRTLLPSTNLGLQFNTISDRTKCSHLKQSHININSTLNDTNKLNHETLSTNTKYTPLINHNRQRLIPQHVLSRLKSLKEMNNSENHYM
ncbi:unnamed protein product [Schistosoma intercalatum]|nr:unnamed protein product [Schistosoma intercalatum]CAH8584087.1 unnamed protein product [Schistosoma intercalatum]